MGSPLKMKAWLEEFSKLRPGAYRRLLTDPTEAETLEACKAASAEGRTDLMREYFKYQPRRPMNIDSMLVQAIYRDRLDLVREFIWMAEPGAAERYFKIACATYSEETAEYLGYSGLFVMEEAEAQSWLVDHGRLDERAALVGSLSTQDWGKDDFYLRAINDTNSAPYIRGLSGQDNGLLIYDLCTIYGCRDPQLFFWAARQLRMGKEEIYISLVRMGNCALFREAYAKYGGSSCLAELLGLAAAEGRTSVIRYILRDTEYLLRAKGGLDKYMRIAQGMHRRACEKLLEDLGWVLGIGTNDELDSLSWLRGRLCRSTPVLHAAAKSQM